MKVFFPLYGDDVFISYSRRDGALYAAGLADKLTEKKLSCFIDKLGTEPNHDLPLSLRKKIKSCTVFVLVGTEKAVQSEFVQKEIAEFKQTGRTILPIDFNNKIKEAIWYEEIPGIATETEKNAEALETGDPSQNVVSFIKKSFNYTRRNQYMFRMFWGALSLFFILIGLGIGSYLFAMTQVDSAKQEARRQELRARDATQKADQETHKANAAEQKAIEKEEVAQEKEIEAKIASDKADKAVKLADEKTKIAADAAQAAKLAEDRKLKAENEARKQETIAAARRLAVEAKFAAEKTQSSVNIGSYDPQRSVLLAIESLKILKIPEGMQSLRGALMNLTGQAFEVELPEEGGSLSASPNGKFLGITKGERSFLRTVKKKSRSEDSPLSEAVAEESGFFEDSPISEMSAREISVFRK